MKKENKKENSCDDDTFLKVDLRGFLKLLAFSNLQTLKDDQEAEDVFIEANKGNVTETPDKKRNKEKNDRRTYKLEISFTLADNEYS